MPSPPFPPRPPPTLRQDDPPSAPRTLPRAPPTTPARPPQSDAARTPRSILRASPSSHTSIPHDAFANPSVFRPQPAPPAPRSATTSPYHHHHTSSSPELRPRADNAWAPRVRPSPQQHPPDRAQTPNPPAPAHPSSYFIPRPRPDQDDSPHKRGGLAARISPHFVPTFRGRSASDVRVAHTPPPDLEPDRLARACGQQASTSPYRHNDRARQSTHFDPSPSRLRDSAALPTSDASPSHPPVPRVRIAHMYRRLDALTRRSARRAMDYVNFEDVAVIHRRDSHLREQLRRKRSERLQEKDPKFRRWIYRRSGLYCRC